MNHVYTYYPNGKVATESFQDAQGNYYRITYDKAGNKTSTEESNPQQDPIFAQVSTYTSAGKLKTTTTSYTKDYPTSILAGTSVSYTYRPNGKVSSCLMTSADGSTTISTYNATGQQTSYENYNPNGDPTKSASYTYFPNGKMKREKITKADGSGNGQEWDSNGILIGMTVIAPDGTVRALHKQPGGFWL